MIVCQQAAIAAGSTTATAGHFAASMIVDHRSPFETSSLSWDGTATGAGGKSGHGSANGRGKHADSSGVSFTAMDEGKDDTGGHNMMPNANCCDDGRYDNRQERDEISSSDVRRSRALPLLPKSPFAEPPATTGGAPPADPRKDGGISSRRGGGLGGSSGELDVATAASSLVAMSLLHRMCGEEGRPRLVMFGDATMAEGVGDGEGADSNKMAGSVRRRSVEGQLAEFRSFWASLAVGGMDCDDQVE